MTRHAEEKTWCAENEVYTYKGKARVWGRLCECQRQSKNRGRIKIGKNFNKWAAQKNGENKKCKSSNKSPSSPKKCGEL